MNMEERLALNKYDVDNQAHIRLEDGKCRECSHKACLIICPAECFKLREGTVSFAYEGCLECGSCRVVCNEGGLDWSYPRSGFGVSYEYG